jgi:hypothetical protein
MMGYMEKHRVVPFLESSVADQALRNTHTLFSTTLTALELENGCKILRKSLMTNPFIPARGNVSIVCLIQQVVLKNFIMWIQTGICYEDQ